MSVETAVAASPAPQLPPHFTPLITRSVWIVILKLTPVAGFLSQVTVNGREYTAASGVLGTCLTTIQPSVTIQVQNTIIEPKNILLMLLLSYPINTWTIFTLSSPCFRSLHGGTRS